MVVVGHHPIVAQTPKDDSERADLQSRLLPVIRRYGNVDMYVCGHIHNFQHLKSGNDGIDYVVNSAGALARKVKAIDGTIFCSPEPGFAVVAASKKTLYLYMIDKNGNVLHEVEHKR